MANCKRGPGMCGRCYRLEMKVLLELAACQQERIYSLLKKRWYYADDLRLQLVDASLALFDTVGEIKRVQGN